ncbi:hypothetical protein B7494_g2025 [Chlorociboria aeruginascens]|nr:hypothetical protein B7494_g2025 [Chlorociboria aeruginascens]
MCYETSWLYLECLHFSIPDLWNCSHRICTTRVKHNFYTDKFCHRCMSGHVSIVSTFAPRYSRSALTPEGRYLATLTFANALTYSITHTDSRSFVQTTLNIDQYRGVEGQTAMDQLAYLIYCMDFLIWEAWRNPHGEQPTLVARKTALELREAWEWLAVRNHVPVLAAQLERSIPRVPETKEKASMCQTTTIFSTICMHTNTDITLCKRITIFSFLQKIMPKCNQTSESYSYYRFCPDCQRQCALYNVSQTQAAELLQEYRTESKNWMPLDPGVVLYMLDRKYGFGYDSDVASEINSQMSEKSEGTAWPVWNAGKDGEKGHLVTSAPGHSEIEDTRDVVDETMLTEPLPNPNEFENVSLCSNEGTIVIGADVVPSDKNKALPLYPEGLNFF